MTIDDVLHPTIINQTAAFLPMLLVFRLGLQVRLKTIDLIGNFSHLLRAWSSTIIYATEPSGDCFVSDYAAQGKIEMETSTWKMFILLPIH